MWNNPDNYRTAYNVQADSDLINVRTLRNEQQSGAADCEEEQITRAEFVKRMVRADQSQYSAGVRILCNQDQHRAKISRVNEIATQVDASADGGASGSAAGAADEAPLAAEEDQEAAATVGSETAAMRDPGTKEARAARLEEIRKKRASQEAAAGGSEQQPAASSAGSSEALDLETVLQKAWSYTLYRHEERLFLSVVCGSSALFDRNVELQAYEIAAFEKEGPASIDALAKEITYSPTAYSGRHIKNLQQWPVKIQDTEEAE